MNYAADLPHTNSSFAHMNSRRKGQGPNQAQGLFIDFLKVLLLFCCRRMSVKELGLCHLGLLAAQSQPKGLQ